MGGTLELENVHLTRGFDNVRGGTLTVRRGGRLITRGGSISDSRVEALGGDAYAKVEGGGIALGEATYMDRMGLGALPLLFEVWLMIDSELPGNQPSIRPTRGNATTTVSTMSHEDLVVTVSVHDDGCRCP